MKKKFDFKERIIDDIKNGFATYVKAIPHDIIFFQIDEEKNLALVRWKTEDRKWFDFDKLKYCCDAWTEPEKDKKAYEIYEEYERNKK